ERLRIAHRELGQHLSVELDVRRLAAGDELVVRHPVRARRGIDAHDPEPPERPFLRLAVTVRVDEGMLDLLLGVPVGRVLEPPVALRLRQDLAALLACVDGTLYARHQRLSFRPNIFRTARVSARWTG